MLINLHGHQLTLGMFNQHPHWGPFWENESLRIGEWTLGKKTPESKGKDPSERAQLEGWIEKRWTAAPRLAALDASGIDTLVVSLPSHMGMYWAEPEFGATWAQTVNDELAEFCSSNTDRLKFWAHLPLQDPETAAKELDRAVTQLGAKGAGVGGANFGGLEFDDEEFFPLWEKVCELDVPLFVHGYNQSVTWGKEANTDRYDTTSIVGMCYDEARCFWNFVCGGVFDTFPDLNVYITHGGGYVPYQLGRFAETLKTMAPDSKNKRPLEEYLTNFYFDPLVHQQSMRRAIVDVIGSDRLLYGDNFGGSDSINFDLTEGIGLSEHDREKIRSGNAIKLLKL